MSGVYTNPFGGGVITPSPRSFAEIDLTLAVTQLIWPGYVATSGQFTTADFVLFASASSISEVWMPDASVVGVGTAVLFANQSAFDLTLKPFGGAATIGVLEPGQYRLVILIDSGTSAGTWISVLYGVGMGSLDAGGAAGAGLSAEGSQLQLNIPTSSFSASYNITPTDRANLFVWTGGAGVLGLPVAATVGEGFSFLLRNQGTGTLTLSAEGGETVDAVASVALQPQDSAFVSCDGVNAWFTVGRGRNQAFNFTLLLLPVTGGTVTLTATQAANVVQRFTGVLSSNCIIQVPPVVQCYYVSNATTGAFTLTLRVTGGAGASVLVPQNQNVVLFCDGTNVLQTTTVVSGLTSLTLALGSLSAPAILFNDGSISGIYSPTGGTVGVSSNARDVMRFVGSGSAVNYLQATASATGARVSLSAQGTDSNIGINITPKGTGPVIFGASANLGIGGVTTPAYKVDVAGAIGLTGNIEFVPGVTDFRIRTNTLDGADDARILISSAQGVATSRGALIILAGNEAATAPGRLSLFSGTSGEVFLQSAVGVKVETSLVSFTAGAGDRVIGIDTVNGADDARLQLCGASTAGFSRGASIFLAGNEYSLNPGRLTLSAGSGDVVVDRGSFLLVGNTPLGYGSGSGGSVTQLTNKSTGVTLSTPSGRIIMASGNIAAGASVSFEVTCTHVSQYDLPLVCLASGGSAANYDFSIGYVNAGAYGIVVRNVSAGGLNEILNLNVNLLKGSNV